MLQRSLRVITIASFFLSVIVITAKAQTSRGTIVGHITDPSGAAVPGARVTITDLGTNFSVRYPTGNTGDYYIPALVPGRYRVEVQKTGFKKAVVNSVTLEVDQTLRVDMVLQLGQTTQTVSVAAAAPMLQTDTTTLGNVVTTQQLNDLPLNGRDFTDLVRLNAGVSETFGTVTTAKTVDLHGYDTNWEMVSVNGARPASVSYLIDGVSVVDPQFERVSVIPPPDAIQEFKLQNGLYSSQFGFGAAQVNVALKSGTNSLHGSLWEFLQNDALQPMQPFYKTKTPLKQNEFGFTVGGPVEIPRVYHGRNHTFFFASYQGGRQVTTTFSQTQVPTSAERGGSFSDWPTPLYNPLTGVPNPSYSSSLPPSVGNTPVLRAQFPGNQIPSSMLAPQSLKILQYYPAANVNCTLPCDNYDGAMTSVNNLNQYMVRADHDISGSDRLFGQWLYSKETLLNPALIPLSGTNTDQSGGVGSLQWTHIFGPRTVNEARFGFNRFNLLSDFQTGFGTVNYWQQVGLTNLNSNSAFFALPAVSLATNYSGIGYSGTAPIIELDNTFQWNDVLTMTRGRNSIAIGADIRRNQIFNDTGSHGNGTLSFNGEYTAENPILAQTAGVAGTGNAFADFLLGYMNAAPSFSAFDASYANDRNSDFALYFQDQYRVTPRLTADLGLRWEVQTPFHETSDGGRLFNFNYPGGQLLYANSSYTQLGNNPILFGCCAKPSLINTDWKDWSPRVGFAFRPLVNNDRLVVRAGYGIFYDVQENYYLLGSTYKDVPLLSPTLSTPTGLESTPPLNIRDMYPAPYSIADRSFPTPYCQAPSSSVVNSAGVVTDVLNYCDASSSQIPNARNPYLQQWGLNIQYQLTPTMMMELGYQGSHGLREPIQWIFNQASPPPQTGNPNNSVQFASQCPAGTLNVSCSPIQDRVPYTNFADSMFANANILMSKYEGMTFKLDKRFSGGFQTLVAYTYSHAIDQFSEIQAQSGTISSIAPDAHDLNLLWGSASFDERNRLVWSSLYQLPFGEGKRFLQHGGVVNEVLGGWQTNGIVTISNGPPFDIGCECGDRAQIGNIYNTEHMNLVGNPLSGFTQSDYERFNPAAFATPTLGTQGTAGRNILSATHQTALDFSLFKNFKITERVSSQFRAEIFNLPSSETYVPLFPTDAATSTAFGTIIDKSLGQNHGLLFDPRVIQLALKLNF
jgi:hypothetical protein